MYKIKCANPNCDSVLSTNNNQKIFYCSFGCSGKAYQLKQNYPQEYCDSYMVNEKEFYRNVNTQSDFRTRFIKSLNSYSDTINYDRGKIDTVIKFVINYLQHLKADLSEALNNTNINIDVFYVKEGLFAEVKIREYFLRFYRRKTKIIIISNDLFQDINGDIVLMDYQIHSLKELPRNMDEMMSLYLEFAFTEKCIVEMNDAE